MRAAPSTAVALLVLTVLAVSSASSSVAHGQARAWDRPLREARAAYAERRFPDAARLFAQADALLGNFPYEERPEYDGEGHWVHAAERQPIRDAIQCPWALAVLTAPPTGDDAELAIDRAIARVRLSCSGPDRARAAMLRGDPLEAALLSAREASPVEDLGVSPEALAWAAAADTGRLPRASDLPEALRFVRAHAAAEHGLDTRCGAPFARRLHATVDDPDELFEEQAELDEESPIAPFESGTPDAIAFVPCFFESPIDPYADEGMPPPGESVEYLLLRERSGAIRIVGWFVGLTSWECWTGVIQGELGHGVVPLGAGRRLYTITRVEGWDYGHEPSDRYVTRETVVCDPARGACRTIPISVDVQTVEWADDERPTVTGSRWQSAVRFTGGRVSLARPQGAPAVLARFAGRGVSLDDFFAAPTIGREQRTLAPTASAQEAPNASVDASCPWRVADADGQTNVRATASSRAAIAATIANDTTVTVAERQGRWWRITAPHAGWVWAPNLAQRCP